MSAWRKILLGEEPRVAQPALHTPRLLAGAGAAAWAHILSLADEGERSALRQALKETLPSIIRENRETETRAASPLPQTGMEKLGGELADLLFQVDPKELER